MTREQQCDIEHYLRDMIEMNANDKDIVVFIERDYRAKAERSHSEYKNDPITPERYKWIVEYIEAHPLPKYGSKLYMFLPDTAVQNLSIAEYEYVKGYLGVEPISLKPIREGREALEYMLSKGTKLLPVWEESKAKLEKMENGKWRDDSYIQNSIVLANIMSGRGNISGKGIGHHFCRFAFSPKSIGLICLDIDCNHKGGRDGLSEFYKWLKTLWGVIPDYLSDIAGGSYPFYVTTPSGGYHLYFKYRGETTKAKQRLKLLNGEAIEVEVIVNDATAPGSYRPAIDGKAAGGYTLYGNIENAITLPLPVENAIATIDSRVKINNIPTPKKYTRVSTPKAYYGSKAYPPPTLEKILKWAKEDHPGGGHNELQRTFAAKVGNRSMQYPSGTYTIEATLAFVREHNSNSEFGTDPDTEGVIKRAYSRGQEYYAGRR